MKNECRFGFSLNPNNPLHKTAIDALNAQGRRKSEFIANAVVHYIMNDKNASAMVIPTTEDIRTVCREVFDEMMQNYKPIPSVIQKEEPIPESEEESAIDLGMISDTLIGFRKK